MRGFHLKSNDIENRADSNLHSCQQPRKAFSGLVSLGPTGDAAATPAPATQESKAGPSPPPVRQWTRSCPWEPGLQLHQGSSMALAIQLSTQTGLTQQDTPPGHAGQGHSHRPLGMRSQISHCPGRATLGLPPGEEVPALRDPSLAPPLSWGCTREAACARSSPRPNWVFSRWSPTGIQMTPPDPPRGFI